MTENVVRQTVKVSRADRQRLNGHKGICLWLTGMSGAGKSTIANAIEQSLHAQGVRTYLLDGDNLRLGLNQDLGFTEEDRQENVRRVAHVANLFVDAGVVVLAALISPFQADRATARQLFDDDSFVEIHVNCPVEVCEARDPKGLYRKAKAGLIQKFTGVSSPYEIPLHAEITLNTSTSTVDACVSEVIAYLEHQSQLMYRGIRS